MKKKIIKNVKFKEIDLHLKYTCPDSNCLQEHWLSIKEARVKNFKIVCECGSIFQPKQIKKLIFKYASINKNKASAIIGKKILSQDTINKCKKSMAAYGFSADESEKAIIKALDEVGVEDCLVIIKKALNIIGGMKNG